MKLSKKQLEVKLKSSVLQTALNNYIQKAIPFGTAKINVNTENQIASAKAVRDVLNNDKEVYDPRKYLGPAREAIKETVKGKIKEFGTSNRAK